MLASGARRADPDFPCRGRDFSSRPPYKQLDLRAGAGSVGSPPGKWARIADFDMGDG